VKGFSKTAKESLVVTQVTRFVVERVPVILVPT